MLAYIDKHIGPQEEEKTQSGLVSFAYFLQIYKTAFVWNRVKFQDAKKKLISKRRRALKENNLTEYRAIQI